MAAHTRTVLHLLRHLEVGGMRTKLYHFLAQYPDPSVRHVVLSFGRNPALLTSFNLLANVQCEQHAEPAGNNPFRGLAHRTAAIAGAMRRTQPDLVHSWYMSTHASLLPMIPALSQVPVLLTVDSPSVLHPQPGVMTHAMVQAMRAFFINQRTRVHSISERTTDKLVASGLPARRIYTYSNGINTDYFAPSAKAAESLCHELDFAPGTMLVGAAARHRPDSLFKDMRGFVRAVAALKDRAPDLYARSGFVACGFGTDGGDLQDLAMSLGVAARMRMLGSRHDMPRIYSALRIFNMCSLYEPFGLVVPEAMACGTPCVVTDTDVLPRIVDQYGRVVPKGDAQARARAWADILTMPDAAYDTLSRQARQHVVTHYSHARMVQEYAAMYETMMAMGVRAAAPAVPAPQG